VSNDGIQSGSALDLISVVPLTTARAETALRPRLPAQHGLDVECVAVCDGVRALVRSRFLRKIGTLTTPEMNAIMAARALVEAYSPGIT
jgi:mRNA interferase MazF